MPTPDPVAATTPRDWGCVNVRLLWKHRHVHPMIRDRLRWWIYYARTA